MSTASPAELTARRLVAAAERATAHKAAGCWIRSHDVADRLGVLDVDDAVKHAASQGWIEVEREHSIRVTDAGRRLAKPRQCA